MWAYTFSGDVACCRGLGLVELARGDAVAGPDRAAGWDAAEQPQINTVTVATASSGAANRAVRPGPTVLMRRLPTVCTLAKTGPA